MASKSRNSIPIENPDARPPLQSSDEVVEVFRADEVPRCTAAGSRQLSVLVADDNRDAADSLAMLVELWGYEVRVVYDGAAALEMASAYQTDVLLLDVTMPMRHGYEVARQLRREARFKDTLLIAITGWADQAHRRLGEEAGFDLYLAKPVEPSTLEVLLVLEHDRLAHSGRPAIPGEDGIQWNSATDRKRGCVASVR
jgi:CheY-like chemotaxis protein